MSDAINRGITVTEIAPMDRPIDVTEETTAAFIGRALRGPLNTPILLRNFAEFRRRFGATGPGSGLACAAEQFFAHGGRSLFVVRVANGARGAMVCLPALRGVLVLRAVEPGTCERIRAAVDYDGIDDKSRSLFNLTLQRLAPDNDLVLDQEIFRRITCEAGQDRNVGDVLLASSLVRVQSPLPQHRPAATGAGYVEPVQDGSDGQALSDYDLVGSAHRNTGVFALNQVEHFDLLYMPPPDTGDMPGPAAVLAAEIYCQRRGAMLVLDPPASWRCAYDAIRGIRDGGYANADVLTYFPRARRRADDDATGIPIGGAIAGLLCRLDRMRGPWEDLDQRGFSLQRELMPAMEVFSSDAHLLVKEGINVIAGKTPGHVMVCGSVTLANGTRKEDQFARLTTRRLCHRITKAIDRATRWAIFEADAAAARDRVATTVHAYLKAMADAGAFGDDQFLVQCDTGGRRFGIDPHRSITLLLAFRPAGSQETVSLTIHQSAAGCRVTDTAFAPVRADVA